MILENIPEFQDKVCIKHPDRKAVVIIKNYDPDDLGAGFCNECNISLSIKERSDIAFDAYLASRSTKQDIPALVAERRRLLDDIARMRTALEKLADKKNYYYTVESTNFIDPDTKKVTPIHLYAQEALKGDSK